MNYLIDTHIFLWWLDDNKKLKKHVKSIISDPENIIYLSAASAWEMSIKKSLGKLKIDFDLSDELKINGIEPLPITMAHCKVVEYLPYHHQDPFDRMLIAQSKSDNITLISHDKTLGIYDANVLLV